MARKHGYEIDPNQELIAQGMSRAARRAWSAASPVDGSLSKTSVADAAGQRTQMASLINAVFILLTMLFLASLFENLPERHARRRRDRRDGRADHASRELKRYYRVNRADWVFFMGAGLGILFFGIIQGILIGVVLSLLLLIARASRTSVRRLRLRPGSDSYHDTARHAASRPSRASWSRASTGRCSSPTPTGSAPASRNWPRDGEPTDRCRHRRRRRPPDRHRRRRHPHPGGERAAVAWRVAGTRPGPSAGARALAARGADAGHR